MSIMTVKRIRPGTEDCNTVNTVRDTEDGCQCLQHPVETGLITVSAANIKTSGRQTPMYFPLK